MQGTSSSFAPVRARKTKQKKNVGAIHRENVNGSDIHKFGDSGNQQKWFFTEYQMYNGEYLIYQFKLFLKQSHFMEANLLFKVS